MRSLKKTLMSQNMNVLKNGSYESMEIIQDMNIPDSVLLSLFMSSNYKCNTAHAPQKKILKQFSIFEPTQKELIDYKGPENMSLRLTKPTK